MIEHDLGAILLVAVGAAVLMFAARVIAWGELADEREGRDRGRRYTDLRHLLDAPSATLPNPAGTLPRQGSPGPDSACTCRHWPLQSDDDCPRHNQAWRGR